MRMYLSYVIKPVCKTLNKDTVRTWIRKKTVIEHQNASVYHSIHVFSALPDSDSGPEQCQAYNLTKSVHLLEETM